MHSLSNCNGIYHKQKLSIAKQMDILKTLAKGSFMSILMGFVVITVCCLSDGLYDGSGERFIMILFLTALNFFLVFGFMVIFLIPLSRIERKRIEERQSLELLKRYLPIIVLPIIIIFSLIIKSEMGAGTAPSFFIIGAGVITQFSVGLWTFLKSLKSKKQ